MTDRDLMKQALDAMLTVTDYDALHAAKIALRKRLAQPEQKPTGYWDGEFSDDGGATLYEVPQKSLFGRKYPNIPLYTTPPAAQQEPVWDASVPIVMTPHPAFAKRQWVGLTDRERDQFYKYVTMPDLVKAIEQALKEKNT